MLNHPTEEHERMPHSHPSTARLQSALQRDAQLVVNLLLGFRSGQERTEGYWSESGPAAKVRLTCHILEALYLLDPDALRTTLDNGLSWLVNLSDGLNNGQATEDMLSACQHPSRFKTLIWLEQFTDDEIQEEFNQLGSHLNADGYLVHAHINMLLASMIYMDGLLLLEQQERLTSEQAERKACIQSMLAGKLDEWCTSPSMVGDETLDPGKLSYALDLLVRAGQLDVESEVAKVIQRSLSDHIFEHRNDRPLDSDILYCAIHLISHFRQISGVAEAVSSLVSAIRQKYVTRDFRRESSSFNPLYVRLLIHLHGPKLKSEVMNLLLDREQAHRDEHEKLESEIRRTAFEQIVTSRVRASIQEDIPLTGGLTRAEVFRVKFQVYLSGVGEESTVAPMQIAGGFNSMVVKIDSLGKILAAIDRYEKLPAVAKPYFATHVGPPTALDTLATGQAYLVLEDLTERYDTFRSIVDKYDRRRLSSEQREVLIQACDTVLSQLFEIYEHTRQPASVYSGSQLHRLYFGRMERALVEAAQKHTHLKSWYGGFRLGDTIHFPGMEHYHNKLDRFRENLRVKHLMLVHGDCHTRNIMIDDCYERIKLIDLDRISKNGDYIQDISMLLEDIAVFRFVFDPSYANFMDTDQVIFPAHDRQGIENRVEYPPLTSRMVIEIQQHIMNRVEQYALSIGDEEWRARLWLALGIHLLRLVEKQEDTKRASVLYVEAIKLFDVLEKSLEQKEMPEGVPFPGIHTRAQKEKGEQPLWPQLSSGVRSKLLQLHLALEREIANLRIDVARTGASVRYFTAGIDFPILIINGERSPIQLLLAAAPSSFRKHRQFIGEYRKSGALRTIVNEDAINDTQVAVDIIRQAIARFTEA